MSYSTEYKIGTTVENMKYVESLVGTGNAPNGPKGMAIQPWTLYRTAVSGRGYGDGYPNTEWNFTYLNTTMFAALMDYIGDGNQSAVVYIRTRNDEGTYANYKAIMHRPRPRQDMVWDMRHWSNVRVRFTHLELQEEE
ncbi:MAG: hypothetical protein M0R06_17070, partial [Sphaerochaeta sp.]|nr:hypothetical protein [Sphaerochaeta sp.]